MSCQAISRCTREKKLQWLPELRNFSPATPLVLVGLKKDLRDNRDALVILEHLDREPVSSGKGREMAKKIKAFKYIECSAVTGVTSHL